ncbi:hypothetical protein [Sphingorhabdus sp. YGSMI21]|uniref:hypothetical protein n=1 Tax=Sphingorhabdus sp. YGSMI21 TaxID=2077182 RepID=UPI000C1DF1D3|nr:hypothetical protein [Sphingorhabdus sp. YGSMI21]ATW03012.1 hypothetical protein CHN51_05265 [Sphingorhabdus sp. YGSMI21]
MIPIAIINSRSETMVVASLLDAAGILVHIGGYHHASVSICPLALGGFRLTVPAFQHAQASAVILDTPGFGEFRFSYGLRRAVVKFLLLWIGIVGLLAIPRILYDPEFWIPSLALIPLSVLGVPVNPQGCSEYFLARTAEA